MLEALAQRTQTDYDAEGRVVETRVEDLSPNDPCGQWVRSQTQYDLLGRRVADLVQTGANSFDRGTPYRTPAYLETP